MYIYIYAYIYIYIYTYTQLYIVFRLVERLRAPDSLKVLSVSSSTTQ